MVATLPATHLARRFALFALTVMFLLTMLRAGHVLQHFVAVEGQGAVLRVFLQGLRFDLAFVGLVCLVPVVLGPLLGVFGPTRGLARWLVVACLVSGLLLMLLAELVTPWFLVERGLRPGVPELAGVGDPLGAGIAAVRAHPIAAGLGALLAVLVTVAFWVRLEVSRLLRFPLDKGSALALAVLGGAACALAIWSSPDRWPAPLSIADAQISDDATVNELTMNSAWKTLVTVPALVGSGPVPR